MINLNDQKVYKNIFHSGKWAGVFQFTEKGLAGELRSPIAVEDLRDYEVQGFLQGVEKELDFQGVGNFPGEDV